MWINVSLHQKKSLSLGCFFSCTVMYIHRRRDESSRRQVKENFQHLKKRGITFQLKRKVGSKNRSTKKIMLFGKKFSLYFLFTQFYSKSQENGWQEIMPLKSTKVCKSKLTCFKKNIVKRYDWMKHFAGFFRSYSAQPSTKRKKNYSQKTLHILFQDLSRTLRK